jgi:hypothetical protein
MFGTTSKTASTASKLSRLLAWALLALAAGAGAAGASPAIEIGNGKQPVAALYIGDDLSAGLEDVVPDEIYRLRLRDSDGTPIAEFTATSDAAGRIEPRVFWPRTGVWGCDLGVSVNNAFYQYQQFADAEDALAGQTLVLEAFREDDTLAASRNVPILSSPQEIAYFSDAAGCLRHHFRDDEHVYVSLRHPSRNALTRRLFLTPAGSLPSGASFTDVRGLATPPLWTLPATGNPVTVKVWDAGLTSLGSYCGIIRWTSGTELRVLASDLVDYHLATPPDAGGIVISVDGCPGCSRP